MNDSLVLGPMMRYVDLTSASIWVETRDAAQVSVTAGQQTWTAQTFGVHGHHYALVEADGLEPGTVTAYTVSIDGIQVWPEQGSGYPPSMIATLAPGKPIKMAFGSCRTSVPHNAAGNSKHGVDSMRAYALNLAAGVNGVAWPDLVVFLGDQVYADVTSDAMQEFIKARRDIDEEPGEELKDYEEYAHLYNLAWSDDANRWLLSTLPSAMIFDDHDIRDDWNTSLQWKHTMEATSWWQGRIVSGLASYWVHQHLGNLSPEQRAQDEIWQLVTSHTGDAELDLSDALDAFADRTNQEPSTYRWSFSREIGDVRLVVLDSRAGRVLDPAKRSILDDKELEWLDGQMQGGFRHLLIATSLPFLLPTGLHHIEAWNEALADGAWGSFGAKIGEKMRRTVDLEHWGAFQRSFRAVAGMAVEVADGKRGPAPETVTFLSGDVHFSYVSEVERSSGSRIIQAVCSPIRNPLPRAMRFLTAILSYGVASPVGALVARSAKVPDPPFRWSGVKGPWFDNNLAGLQDGPDGLRFWWERGVVDDGDHLSPRLEEVATVTVSPRATP
ncbi:alkaline phosphatase D family protein [Arthrobacter sp. CAN_A1]|uniref:alkaline phosphatase D family protein n=1 Tax=Arthrobacter sp. CAN_A1 TaxID=2787717 RepID=UPI0018CB6C3B